MMRQMVDFMFYRGCRKGAGKGLMRRWTAKWSGRNPAMDDNSAASLLMDGSHPRVQEGGADRPFDMLQIAIVRIFSSHFILPTMNKRAGSCGRRFNYRTLDIEFARDTLNLTKLLCMGVL
jgi:hypothetical protein